VQVEGVEGRGSFHPDSFVWRCIRTCRLGGVVIFVFLRYSHIELFRWSVGPTSWATSCVTVESNLSFFLVFRTLSRASCASLSSSRWKVSVLGSSRDRSFLRVWIAFR